MLLVQCLCKETQEQRPMIHKFLMPAVWRRISTLSIGIAGQQSCLPQKYGLHSCPMSFTQKK